MNPLIKHSYLLILLFLAACSTPPAKPPVQPTPEVAPVKPAAKPTPALGPQSQAIVDLALAEWKYFGEQTVVFNGEEESIPRVGIWEDENPLRSERIRDYWRSVGKGRLSGYDCSAPWSAAFISWLMQEAGVPSEQFPPTAAHRVYLNHLLQESEEVTKLKPQTILQYQAKPGDLLCATRGSNPSPALDALPLQVSGGLHCDLVVANDGKTLQLIGGNVRNSVSKTIITLSPEGYVIPTRKRPWFIIIENRLDH